MIWRILSLLSIPLVLWAFWGLVRQVRKPQRLRALTPVIGIVMSLLMLTANVFILHRANPTLLGGALLVVGIGFGLAWGQATRLAKEGDTVMAERSALHIIFWAVSFAMTQVLATFAPASWVAAGLAAMFFSAGATLGTSANLFLRRERVRKEVRPPSAQVG